jgi:alpha-L-rhamnosidase
MGLVDKKNRKKVVNKLVETVKKTDYHIDAGILGAKFLLHALADNGYEDAAYKIISNKTFPGWGWWIEQGATTLWEHWDGRISKPQGSLNHIMFGDISNWFFRNIAGIQPDIKQAGFKHFFVRPKLVDQLDWCDASYESVYVEIKVKWKKEAGKFILELKVPGNTKARVSIPARSERKVLEGGKYLSQNKIDVLSMNHGFITFEVGSGSYVFESTMQ